MPDTEVVEKPINQEALEKLGIAIASEFAYNEKFRRDKEIEWVESLRQVKGIYDPETEKRIPSDGSKVYPKYTRSKETPCIAKLNSMLFPDNDRNWDIDITPMPKLSDGDMQMVADQVVKAKTAAGQQPTPDDIVKGIKRLAQDRCDEMEREMDDQLTEMNYKGISKRVVRSGVRYGTGVLKGPLAEAKDEVNVVQYQGQWKQEVNTTYIPAVTFVPLWYWYPDMTATELEDCGHFYELHVMSKHELRKLKKMKGFLGDVIEKIIKDAPTGNYKFKPWQIDLQNLGDKVNQQNQTNKYEVHERWGYVDGGYLEAAGIEIPADKMEVEYFANIWECGQQIIKIILSPVPEDIQIYHVFYFDKDESSIFGQGLPRIIRDTDITIAAASRMLLDNAACVCGPQVEINVDYLVPGQVVDEIHARKIWYREGRGQEAQYPLLRNIEFNSHIQDLVMIIQEFKRFGDEESSLPASVFGPPEKGINETARGSSIRSSNIMVTLADIKKSYDDCNEGLLKSLYRWNMEFNDKPEIKGDFNVKASGSDSIMSKEARTQALDYFASTLTPMDEPYIDRREFLIQRATVHDLPVDRLIVDEKTAQERMAAQRDAEAEALAKEKMKSEIRYDHAKASHMEAKADGEAHDKHIKEVDAGSRALQAVTNAKKGEHDQEMGEAEAHLKTLDHFQKGKEIDLKGKQQQNKAKVKK